MKATLNIFGEISNWDQDFNAQKALEFFNDNPNADEYEIIINSNGGVVSTGFAIADIIKTRSDGKKVTTVAYSCMSIATIIFLAGTERLVSPNSEFMIHNPWVGFAGGEASDLEKVASDLRRIEDKSVAEYMKFSTVSEDKIRELMKEETFIKSADLVEMGFATAILEPVNLMQLPTYHKAVAYHKNKSVNMSKIEERLNKLTDSINKLIKPEPEALQVSLDDGRIVEVVTKEEKANVGDTIRLEGKALEDGEYLTAETQEKYTVSGGKIESIEDVSEETMNAENVEAFVMKAGEKTAKAIMEEMKLYAKSTDLEAIQAKHTSEMEAMQAKLDEAESKITEISQSFQEALKEIKASLVSDFGVGDEENKPTKRELKPWEKDMQKIKEKTNQV